MADPPTGASERSAVTGPGTLVGERYRLESRLATGGMATVWRAVDEVLTRPVAVKILHDKLAADPDFVARFRREAVAAARLAHPSIVAIYDTCSDPEAIVMELVEGRTLRAEIDARGFLPPTEAVEVASGIARALDVAHQAGLVHRDVKPANVLLSADGRLKVADFGIAKAARTGDEPHDDPDLPDLTTVGHMVGTAKYLSPEQVSGGDVDARTDVYALGAVLYEMVCGRPPFSGENDLATATARLHGPPPRPRSVLRTVPEHLDAIVMKAMATDPEDRYESASALWSALQATPATADDGTGPVATVDATTIEDAPSFARAERSWLVPALLVSVVAIALGLAWLLIGGDSARRDLGDLVDRVRPGGGATPTEPVAISVASFDPLGDRSESDDEVPFATDGDPATQWTTERYNTRDFGGLKEGLGLLVDVGESRELGELALQTPDADWSAAVYVTDVAPEEFADLGEPAAVLDAGTAGTTSIDLSDHRGSFVLFWLTDLGDDPGVEFHVQELGLTAG